MGWVIFCGLTLLIAVLFVPPRGWKRHWLNGIAAMPIIFLTDTTLVWLGAFSFKKSFLTLLGVPVFYLVSSFSGGVLFAYFRPAKWFKRIIYVFVAAFLLLLPELLMKSYGYFEHIRWNDFHSYLLNVFGFTVLMQLQSWCDEIITRYFQKKE